MRKLFEKQDRYAIRREATMVADVERGLDDMRAGRVVPHAKAIRRLRATIDRVAKAKPSRL